MIDFKNGSLIKLHQDSRPKVNEISPLLIPGEDVIGSFSSVRDYVVFTNKRMIVVNVQGVTGKKKDFTILPYSKLTAFSIETSGVFDMDSELELYFSGLGTIRLEFTGGAGITKIGQIISQYLLG